MSPRAFAITEFGAEGSVQDMPSREPGEGEVRVAVHAAGVNVIDPFYIAGRMKEYQEHRFPFVPGIDFAGVVDAVGSGVDRFAVGDQVYGVVVKPFAGAGSFAESVVVAADTVAPKPTTLDLTQSAAVPHAGLTALGVIEAADPKPGQIVVVVGATGGVGSFVTQFAALRGAIVVAVASGSSAAQAREYGAAATIDYARGNVADQLQAAYPDGIDVLVHLHGDADRVAELGRTVRPGGIVVSTIGRGVAAAVPGLEARGVRFASAARLPAARLPELTAIIDGGQLRVPPIKVFPLERTAEALAEMATGHVRGKLVIQIA
ncbi:MAG: NADP-dependent oxidoreductase [Candidatus Limnocylindrales bacterium]